MRLYIILHYKWFFKTASTNATNPVVEYSCLFKFSGGSYILYKLFFLNPKTCPHVSVLNISQYASNYWYGIRTMVENAFEISRFNFWAEMPPRVGFVFSISRRRELREIGLDHFQHRCQLKIEL